MADNRLDQVMFDVKQSSAMSGAAETNLKENIKDAEALRDIMAGVDEEQRKVLATELQLGEGLKESTRTIEGMKESLSKIPSVAKSIDVIQKKTGKSYKESLDLLTKSIEATKKHTKANQALLNAAKALEKSYMATSDQIDKGTKSLKNFGKTQAEIDKQKRKDLQSQQEMIKKIGANLKSVFGGAGASGISGILKGGAGISGAILNRVIDKTVTSEKANRRFKAGGRMVGGFADSLIDAIMYEFEISRKQAQLTTRMEALGAPNVSLRQKNLTREEVDKYASQMAGRGIMPEENEIQNFAANSKRFGDEINANITEKMIISSGTIADSWKHINILAGSFRDIAKDAGVPMLDLMKWTADTAAQVRFLNIDSKIVTQTYAGLTNNLKTLEKVGITRDKIGGIGQRMLGTMGQAPLAMRAFWGQKAGLTGSVDEIIQKVSMGGQYGKLNATGTGYDVVGKKDPTLSLRILEEMKKAMVPLGYTGAMTASKTMLPGFTEEDVRTLLFGDLNKLTDKITEPNVTEKNQATYLEKLVGMEYIKQQWQDDVKNLLMQIASKGTFKDTVGATWETVKKMKKYAERATTEAGLDSKGPYGGKDKKKPTKHTGGIIPKGTVAEVLGTESFGKLGRDSMYAFNPNEDIRIGSPQNTKEGLKRNSASSPNTGEKTVTVNLNVNGSVLTDNNLLAKIEEIFARRMDLIG